MGPATQPQPAHESDGELRNFLAGDPATCRVVERWAWEIVHFRWFGIPVEDRRDVIQDTVADVWRAVSQAGFTLRIGLRPLVRKIATARCIDRMRRRRPTAELSEALQDPNPGPYEQLLRKDESARVRWALQSMDPRCREIIQLHFVEDLPYAEIAAREQRSEATMRVRMFQCMKALRSLFARWTR